MPKFAYTCIFVSLSCWMH